MRRRKWIALVAAVVAAAAFVACKQGKGDRCQINSDCSGGLVCSPATQTCVVVGATDEIDAGVPDAPHDAPHDAAVDAHRDAPHD